MGRGFPIKMGNLLQCSGSGSAFASRGSRNRCLLTTHLSCSGSHGLRSGKATSRRSTKKFKSNRRPAPVPTAIWLRKVFGLKTFDCSRSIEASVVSDAARALRSQMLPASINSAPLNDLMKSNRYSADPSSLNVTALIDKECPGCDSGICSHIIRTGPSDRAGMHEYCWNRRQQTV